MWKINIGFTGGNFYLTPQITEATSVGEGQERGLNATYVHNEEFN